MEDLNDKVITNTLTAPEWNQIPSEIQNIIEATLYAQTLTNADLNQLGKGVAGYAASAAFYTGSGTANAHIATKLGGMQAPPNYADGMIVRFRPSNANTAAATINVDSLGVKSIIKEDGTVLSAGDLGTDRDAWLRYNGTSFLLSNWAATNGSPGELGGYLSWISATTVRLSAGISGEIAINVDGVRLTRTADLDFTFADLDTGSEVASTPYYLYIDNLAGVMDPVVSVTGPTLPGAAGKVGYHPIRTDERCIGGFWNDESSDITQFMLMPGGLMLFKDHGSTDHQYDDSGPGPLVEVASTSWVGLTLNLPVSASSVLFHASLRSNTAGMAVYGADGATGTLTDNGQDIFATGFEDVLFAMIMIVTGNPIGKNVSGEIPITTLGTMAMEFGLTGPVSQGGSHQLSVRGYRDMFAPRL